MRRNYTDLLLLAVLFLMLFALHCKGAVEFSIYGDSILLMDGGTTYPELNGATNDITISYWCLKDVKAFANGGRFLSRGQTSTFDIKTDGTVGRWMDYQIQGWGPPGNQLWRSNASYDVTNVWVHHLWTYTFTDTNSLRLYTNGVNMPGVWVFNPRNIAGTNAVSSFGVNSEPPQGNCVLGLTSEVAIWQKILNFQQRELLRTSRVKGICKQIEPSFLRLYLPLDSTPRYVVCHNGDLGDGGKFNFHPERAVGTKFVAQPAPAPGGSSIGAGEHIHSYQPNE